MKKGNEANKQIHYKEGGEAEKETDRILLKQHKNMHQWNCCYLEK